jgi:hypothetical protein
MVTSVLYRLISRFRALLAFGASGPALSLYPLSIVWGWGGFARDPACPRGLRRPSPCVLGAILRDATLAAAVLCALTHVLRANRPRRMVRACSMDGEHFKGRGYSGDLKINGKMFTSSCLV